MDEKFYLDDRIEKVKSMNKMFNLEKKSYISFSGGKDSCVLSKLIDLALPNNEIPRIYFDTGLEYRQMKKFILEQAEKDERIMIFKSNENVTEIWRKFGYPMKSKQYSHILHIFQNSGKTISVRKFLKEEAGNNKIVCSKKFKYQFSEDFKIKVSDMCCTKLKKQVARRFEKQSGLKIAITGIRASEGGQRLNMARCAVFSQDDNLKRFSPLTVCDNNWIEWFIKEFDIKLCELYAPPFSFKRTGCIGCPYALNIGEELQKLQKFDQRQFKVAWNLWRPIYEEYAKLSYRGLDKITESKAFEE